MVSDQYARTNAWRPRRGSPSSISATGSASCALTSLPKRWSPCRGPSQSPFPPRWFWSLAVVGGTEIRQTLLLRLGNPCLLGLEIPIPIPEILAWARSHQAEAVSHGRWVLASSAGCYARPGAISRITHSRMTAPTKAVSRLTMKPPPTTPSIVDLPVDHLSPLRGPQSGEITCYEHRTHHVLPT